MGDKIAAVRVIHDHFYNVCCKHYTPELYVTVDEQMVSFRGGCSVKVYDPSKKNHCFGIKQYHLSDTATYYILAPEIYISGWSPNNEPNYWSGEAIVKRLVRQSQVPRGCGIFGDRFFSSHSLCEWAHSFELTYIGTANSARRFMPPYMKKSELKLRRLMRHESVVVYSDYASLIAYTSKDYNHANFTPVHIISSEHMYNITFEGQKRKPAPMLMYNINKKGVDKGNQMLAHNSVYRASRRWTYRIFCNYLDIAALNSWVIARHNNTDLQYPVRNSGRRRMLRELALQLGEDCMHIRSQINNLPRQIRSDLNALGHQRQRPQAVPVIQRRRGRCELCTVRLRKTTRKTCSLCRRFVCKDHSVNTTVCFECPH